MDGLGRVLNVVPTAAGVEVDLTDAEAVTFVLVGADTYTLQEAQDGTGTGAANLATIDHFYENANAVGTAAWTRNPTSGLTDPAVDNIVVGASAAAAVTVHASELSDGFTHVQMNAGGTGLVTAIVHDLNVQRAPENLPALTG